MPDQTHPAPGVMPLDRDQWKEQLNLSNFVNTYYQYRDVNHCIGKTGRILIIGPGIGLDALVLRWKGYDITTFDIDDTFDPDVLGSCHDMPMFKDRQFDAVIASHVLEHLPLPFLEEAIAEISRVARFAIIYLPVAGKHAQISMKPDFFGRRWSWTFDLFRFWEKPRGLELKYSDGQHYWEVGYRGFRVKNVIGLFKKNFEVIDYYRNSDWIPSFNFILKSK